MVVATYMETRTVDILTTELKIILTMFRPQQHSVHRISDEDPAQQALQAFLKWSSQEAWLNSTPIILSYVAITCHVVFELDAYPFINYTYNESCTGWIVR